MKCLIPTEPDDKQAILVKLALENAGHQVTLMFTADQPTRQKNSVFVDLDAYRWQSTDRYQSIVDNDHDIVWWRRPRKPYIPKNLAHPEDFRFIVRENLLLHESLLFNMAPNAWWINSEEAARRANFKLLQLKTASECGITIPTTLCSNDPEEIRLFLLRHEPSGVIYKSLSNDLLPTKIPSTAKMTYMDLPQNQSLQRAPGIFQKIIPKQYELRVTCFGDYIVAAKLSPNLALIVEPYLLPDDLAQQIRLCMRELGIVFGVFDFIVTPEHEYVFLELNEQGQFFWIEELNPEFKMLDIFVNFMLNKSTDFKWESGDVKHTINLYRNKIEHVVMENQSRHIWSTGHDCRI